MNNYTQRQLAREWNRRSKEQKMSQLKHINIYKLKDGTYTDQDPSPLDIRWFLVVAILLGVTYAVLG